MRSEYSVCGQVLHDFILDVLNVGVGQGSPTPLASCRLPWPYKGNWSGVGFIPAQSLRVYHRPD
jgi:hypothetical protein